MRRSLLLFALVGVLVGGASTVASALTMTIAASSRGWIDQNGSANVASPTANYLTGNSGGHNPGEFRSHFTFAIPLIAGPITGAELLLSTAGVKVNQGPSMTLDITSRPGVFAFADLGTGTLYGQRVYTSADANTTQSIVLNAAAIADIAASQAGTLGVGGRISAGALFGPAEANQSVFNASQFQGTLLKITYVPEPSTALLFGLGLVTLAAGRRSRS